MTQPTVACIMLANGRPEMVARAVKSFRAQTYEKKWLYIIDTGNPWLRDSLKFGSGISDFPLLSGSYSIGSLRNRANELSAIGDNGAICSADSREVICHWDSDDWSHPNRIAEQVALLQSSGAECVGYNEMLFCLEYFKTGRIDIGTGMQREWIPTTSERCGEAWLYRASIPNYAIGTSMCYWRETWERHPFPDRSEGCDDLEWFNKGVKVESVPAFAKANCFADRTQPYGSEVPRMIASIHGGNTCAKIDAKAREWTRVSEWDEYCRNAMRVK